MQDPPSIERISSFEQWKILIEENPEAAEHVVDQQDRFIRHGLGALRHLTHVFSNAPRVDDLDHPMASRAEVMMRMSQDPRWADLMRFLPDDAIREVTEIALPSKEDTLASWVEYATRMKQVADYYEDLLARTVGTLLSGINPTTPWCMQCKEVHEDQEHHDHDDYPDD